MREGRPEVWGWMGREKVVKMVWGWMGREKAVKTVWDWVRWHRQEGRLAWVVARWATLVAQGRMGLEGHGLLSGGWLGCCSPTGTLRHQLWGVCRP